MAHSPHANPDRAIAIVLFCALCGVLLGLGGRALQLRQRAARRMPSPPPAAAPPADLGARPAADLRPGQPAWLPDGGDGGSPRAGQALWVLVLDGRGQPVAGAQVSAHLELSPSAAAPAAPAARVPLRTANPAQPVGELGVLPGPLPYPEEIIGGAYALPGTVQRADAAAATATTDSQGAARLFPVPAGRVQLLASMDTRSAAAEVVVPPAAAAPQSEATALRIVLRLGAAESSLCALPPESGDSSDSLLPNPAGEGPEVSGRVEDSRGFAVSGARLELQSGRVRTLAVSDARGAFSARGLPAGALTVQVRHAGFAPLVFTLDADKPRSELRLKLQPGGGIAGTVRDGRVGGLPPGTQLIAEQSGGLRQTITLSDSGHFVATGLVPGELTLRARAPGYAPLAVTVKVPAGDSPEQVTLHDLRLDLARSASLRGRVRGPDGVAAGAAVSLTLALPGGEQRSVGQLLTDARGEFTASDLPAGRVHVRATSGGTSAQAEVELQAGDTTQTELELR